MTTASHITKTIIDLYRANGGEALRISAVAKACGTTSKRVNDVINTVGSNLEHTQVEVRTGDNFTGYRYRLSDAVQPSRRYLVTLLNESLLLARDLDAKLQAARTANAPSYEQAREAFAAGFRGLTQVQNHNT